MLSNSNQRSLDGLNYEQGSDCRFIDPLITDNTRNNKKIIDY